MSFSLLSLSLSPLPFSTLLELVCSPNLRAHPRRCPSLYSPFCFSSSPFLLFIFPCNCYLFAGGGLLVEDGNIRADNLRVERVKLGGGGGGMLDRSWRKIVSDVRFGEYLWEFVSRLCFSFSQTRRVVERVFQESFGIRCLTVFLSSFCCWYISMESIWKKYSRKDHFEESSFL